MIGVEMGASRFAKLVSKRDVRREKTTEAQHGHLFQELRAKEAVRLLHRQVRKQFGEIIEPDEERPWPGAFAIVSEETVAALLKALEVNGLRRFSDQICVDWFTQAESLPEDQIATLVCGTPIGGEPLFIFPPQKDELATLVFRIVIMDPQFLEQRDQPLYDEIPPRYVEAVLNTLNPAAMCKAYGHHLPEMLKRAGDNAESFQQLLQYVSQQWEAKKTPQDIAALQEYVSLGFLHEAVHALALHLPDQVPADLPDQERQFLEAMSLDHYLGIINGDQSLHTSVVFAKNLMKALEKVEEEPVSQETQDSISILIALEMLCDRFSMYLYENYLKIQLYHDALCEGIGYPVNVDIMLTLEWARAEGRLAGRHEIRGLSEGDLARLEHDLQKAERDHVYIST
ncbi:MAG: hypothetical protein AMS18_04740, partial [Gemmatimonas sp. SG8_17]